MIGHPYRILRLIEHWPSIVLTDPPPPPTPTAHSLDGGGGGYGREGRPSRFPAYFKGPFIRCDQASVYAGSDRPSPCTWSVKVGDAVPVCSARLADVRPSARFGSTLLV